MMELEIKTLKSFMYKLGIFLKLIIPQIIILSILFGLLTWYQNKLKYEIENMYTSSRDTVEDRKYILKKVIKKRNLWLVNLVINHIWALIIINLCFPMIFTFANFEIKGIGNVSYILITGLLILLNWLSEYFNGEKLITKKKIKKLIFKFSDFSEKIDNIKESIKMLEENK